MTLSDDIKRKITPYIGNSVDDRFMRIDIKEIERLVTEAIAANQTNVENIEYEIIVKQTQIYIEAKIMVNTLQEQLDNLKKQVTDLEGKVTALETSVNGLTIGTNVQAWSSTLQAISDLTLGNRKLLGTDTTGTITQYDPPSQRVVGTVILLPYNPVDAGWTVSGAIYTAPDGWKWYYPDGTAIGKSVSVDYEQLYLALWGVTAYTISGGKGTTAQADWDANQVLSDTGF